MNSLSIIIPSYNDESHVKILLSQLPSWAEVVVVESANTDYFTELKKSYSKVQLFKGKKGRAKQMNLGAKKSSGNLLLFLHADSGVDDIDFSKLQTISQPVWGCFSLCFEPRSWFMDFVSRESTMRAKFTSTIYGDQGIFLSRSVFDQIGGFDESRFFEDCNMSKTLKKKMKPIILSDCLKSSARRFQKHGELYTFLIMGLISISYNIFGAYRFALWLYTFIK